MKGISRERFAKTMDALFHGPMPSKVCIAVSGGVDSMALTFLACQYFIPKQVQVTGLVIDHDLRKGSSKEAKEVSQLVKQFGASSRVLKMKWKPQEKTNMARFEVEAREKRLSLLHEACRYRSNVEHLLFAHTLDDQLETLLLRLTRGSSIRGLGGMNDISAYWKVPAPDEKALKLVRPLLEYPKKDLYSTCVENNIKWFEDATNHDPQFTIRNAIRQFLKEPALLPDAFQRNNLVNTLHLFQDKRREAELEAADIVELLTKVGGAQLDEQKARIQFNEFEGFELIKTSTMALALQKLVERIIPTENTGYRFSQFDKIASRMQSIPRRPDFDYEQSREKTVKFSSLSLDWRMTPVGYSHIAGGPRTTIYKWVIQRQLPYKAEHGYSVIFRATQEWSAWKLFDNRYWIRVRREKSLSGEEAGKESPGDFFTVVVKYPSFRVIDLTFMKRFLGERELRHVSPYDVLIQPCVFISKQANVAGKAKIGREYMIENDEDYEVLGSPIMREKGRAGRPWGSGGLEVECRLKGLNGD